MAARLSPRTGLVAYSETKFRRAELRARRTEERKTIQNLTAGGVEMYEMREDPSEKKDLAGQSERAVAVAAEKKELEDWAKSQRRAEAAPPRRPIPDDIVDQLKAMGYVTE